MEERSQAFDFIDSVVLLITIILLVLFVLFLSMVMTYFKTVALTIKTILKAAFEAKSPFLAFKDDIKRIKHTKLREEAEQNMKDTGLQQKYFTRWTFFLDECPKKNIKNTEQDNGDLDNFKKTKFNLLNPPLQFYVLIYI